jgi:hypothetical protein
MPCISSASRGGDHLGDASSAVTPATSSPTAPRGKKLDFSSNKYDYTKRNDYSKSDDKKKYRFREEKKKKKFQKMIS